MPSEVLSDEGGGVEAERLPRAESDALGGDALGRARLSGDR